MPKTYHTKATQEIEQYLSLQKDKSFCVADVYHYLESNNVRCKPVNSVPYASNRMTDNGVLVRFKTASSGNYYYYRISDEHNNCDAHLHMQCRKCGKVMHLDCAFMDEIRKNLMKQYGFTLECNGSTLSGLCRNCKEEQG